MPRYEFVQGTSSKFWEITRDGAEVTVCYGKIGTAGTSKTKSHADDSAAEKDMVKQTVGKTKKGYVLAGGDSDAAEGGESSKQRYEFSQGTSSKFWEASRDGTDVTICYGKIGTAGTSKTKSHADEEAAEKDMAKQAAGKVKKGYVLVGGGGGGGAGGGAGGKQPLVGLEKEIKFGYDDNAKHFVFRSIVDYKPGKPGLSQAAKGKAYRLRFDFDDGGGDEMVERLQQLAKDKNADKLKALVIGAWGEDCCTGDGGQQVIDGILAIKDSCPELEGLYLGDIAQEEAEVSWIMHGDWGPLIGAFPKLEHWRVRGQADASSFSSSTLRSLVVTSMTSRKTAQSIAAADLPELEHLELWLGTDEYGGDAQVEDLIPIFSGKLFPKLRYLGLRNAQQANEFTEALASSPLLERIEVLDLSLGLLDDRGGNALLASPAAAKLKRLDLHHNFFSPAVAKKLRALGPDVDTGRGDAEEDEDGDETYRYVSVGE